MENTLLTQALKTPFFNSLTLPQIAINNIVPTPGRIFHKRVQFICDMQVEREKQQRSKLPKRKKMLQKSNKAMIETLVSSFVVLTVDVVLNSYKVCMKSCFRNDDKFVFTQPFRCFIFHLPNRLLLCLTCLPDYLFGATPPPPPPSPPPTVNNDIILHVFPTGNGWCGQ